MQRVRSIAVRMIRHSARIVSLFGYAKSRAFPASHSRLKPSGNSPAAPARVLLSTTGRTFLTSLRTPILDCLPVTTTRAVKAKSVTLRRRIPVRKWPLRLSGRMRRTPGGFTTCSATCWNGVLIGIRTIFVLLILQPGRQAAINVLCVVDGIIRKLMDAAALGERGILPMRHGRSMVSASPARLWRSEIERTRVK